MLKTSDIRSMAQILRDMNKPPVEEDTDKDEPGTQGDKEAYQKKRKEIANKFGVESCSALKDEKERKACYAALDAAHVSDDEEEDGEKKEEVQKEAHVKHECPKCKGEGCEHCDGKGYHVEDEDDDPVGKNEEAEIDEKFAGWIAFYGGKKLEIRPKKGEIDSLWDAKKLAIDHFKIPKSKQGLLAVKPAHEEVEIEEGISLQIRMALDDEGLKGKWKNNKVYVKKRDVKKAEKALKGNVYYKGKTPEVVGEDVETEASTYRDKKYGKKKTGKVPPSQKASRWGQGGYGKEEVEEKRSATGYDLYHKDFSSAMQHAYAHAKKKGVIVDPKEIDDKVATGPKKPSSGKTNRYILGTNTRKKVHIQVANLDNKRYELNMYIESAIKESALDKVRGMIKEKYVTQDKFFPKVLMDGLRKAIPGVKMARFSIKHPRSGEKIPGLGLQLSGDKGIRVMVQYDKEDAPAPKGMPDKIVDIDPDTGKKEVTDTSFRDSYAVWVNDIGKIWKPNENRWIQTKDFRDPKKVVQFLKTKVKRMTKEEVEIQEHCGECEMGITEEVSAKEFDALKKGDTVTIEFKSPMSTGKSTFKVTAKNVVGKARIEKVTLKNVKRPNTVKFFLYKRGNKVSLAQGDMAASVVSFTKEGIDIEKASMGAVIKDFQNSDAPQFKGKSDKKRREMAIAAKLSKEETEEDDPKSKKKDKINLKPKMEDKQMKKLRELQAGLRKKRAQEGTLKKTVSDYHKEEVVKEAVLDNGLEVGEQEFDLKYRVDSLYPNLDVNFAKYMDEGLEGPYEIGNEVYFYDRKVQMFYSVSGEDYVDEETAKDIAYRLHKHGFYKPELGR